MRTALFITALLVSSCSLDRSPAETWEIAVQGLYTSALSDDAEQLIAGSMNHGASLWNTPTNARLYNWSHQSGEYAELVAASFSPDGTHAITSDPRTLVLWDTKSGSALNYWATPGTVLDAALRSGPRILDSLLSDFSGHAASLTAV